MSSILISNCKPLLYLDPWLAWVGSIGQDESIICEFVGVKPTNVLEYNNLHNIYIYIYMSLGYMKPSSLGSIQVEPSMAGKTWPAHQILDIWGLGIHDGIPIFTSTGNWSCWKENIGRSHRFSHGLSERIPPKSMEKKCFRNKSSGHLGTSHSVCPFCG